MAAEPKPLTEEQRERRRENSRRYRANMTLEQRARTRERGRRRNLGLPPLPPLRPPKKSATGGWRRMSLTGSRPPQQSPKRLEEEAAVWALVEKCLLAGTLTRESPWYGFTLEGFRAARPEPSVRMGWRNLGPVVPPRDLTVKLEEGG